jgi:exocyst complex component 2
MAVQRHPCACLASRYASSLFVVNSLLNPSITPVDAKLLHHLETWIASSAEAHATAYLADVQIFQKHQTTNAFKLAGGVDLASTTAKLGRQYNLPSEFVTKITKAFLDTLYAILDGLALVATDVSPDSTLAAIGITSMADVLVAPATKTGANLLEMLDMMDVVRRSSIVHSTLNPAEFRPTTG